MKELPRRKFSKESANYSPGMEDRRCRNCTYFISAFQGQPYKQGACKLVAGKIDPEYWCKHFRRKR